MVANSGFSIFRATTKARSSNTAIRSWVTRVRIRFNLAIMSKCSMSLKVQLQATDLCKLSFLSDLNFMTNIHVLFDVIRISLSERCTALSDYMFSEKMLLVK